MKPIDFYPNFIYASGSNKSGQVPSPILDDNNSIRSLKQIHLPYSKATVKKVACGLDFMFVLFSDYRVYCSGNNRHGQLGLGHKKKVEDFQTVTAVTDPIVDIKCGLDFTLFLTKHNQIWACGNNAFGKLGIGYFNNNFVIQPKSIKTTCFSFKRIVDAAVGENHVIYLTDAGDIYGCGFNAYGQLGMCHSTDCYVPSKCDSLVESFYSTERVIQVACGANHTIILTKSGKVFATGKDSNGQTGIQVHPWNYSGYVTKFLRVPLDFECKQIACGYDFSLFLSKDNFLYGCGNSSTEVLGTNATTVSPRLLKLPHELEWSIFNQIAGGRESLNVIVNNKEIFVSGKNSHGVLGLEKIPDDTNVARVTKLTYVRNPNVEFELKSAFCCLSHFQVFYFTTKQYNVCLFHPLRAVSLSDIDITTLDE
ncbi:hypothetical protein ABK040_008245 [Willaertia magna]